MEVSNPAVPGRRRTGNKCPRFESKLVSSAIVKRIGKESRQAAEGLASQFRELKRPRLPAGRVCGDWSQAAVAPWDSDRWRG